MPKKKQVTFQNNTPGKFIPRDDPPATSGLDLCVKIQLKFCFDSFSFGNEWQSI